MPKDYAPTYTTSRKAKLEQKKITQQIVFFIVLAIALVLLFLFVILPTVIRILAGLSGTPSTSNDDVPIQAPFVSAPVAATSSARLVLKGFSQKGYTVEIVQNAAQVAEAVVGDDGSFQSEITLTQGENKIAVFAQDANKKQSAVSAEHMVIFDDQPPTLEISKPTDKQSISGRANQNLSIEGNTEPKSKVYLNGRLNFTKEDGSFVLLQNLSEGDNTIEVKAVDQAGNSTTTTLMVSYHH